ncbi:hypothetical protein CRENBAI_012956 [Crenichthys baileyi]|uniref:Uncharacterized protein n=1 Tax=Crenichthys baileyi TaxID=28760 RepID=A0AAV9S167_9TELE
MCGSCPVDFRTSGSCPVVFRMSAHQAGLVCLQVLESGGSVSSSVLFEYRARNASSLPSSQLDWLSLDDNQFRMSILERLEQMERRMAEMAARDRNHHAHQQQQNGNQLATPPPPLPEDHDQMKSISESPDNPGVEPAADKTRPAASSLVTF